MAGLLGEGLERGVGSERGLELELELGLELEALVMVDSVGEVSRRPVCLPCRDCLPPPPRRGRGPQ